MNANPLTAKLRQLRTEAGGTRPVTSPSSTSSFDKPQTAVIPAKAGGAFQQRKLVTHVAVPQAAMDGDRFPRSTSAPPAPAMPPELRRLLQRHAQLKRGLTTVPPSRDREVPGIELSPGLRYTEAFADWLVPPRIIDTGFARMDPVHHDRLLHFDTETTGLAGGTGTRAFMIGAADWQGGRLRLRQLTITTLAAEGAMLRTFAGWLDEDTVLVSYNGKCYDAPLLATRYRLARLPNPLAGRSHLDLLHPVRRHWKHQWPNCRLATAERQLLGVIREDDLPGSEAPAAWLTYLRGGSARNLRRVATHNAQDLKSLAGVLLHMAGMATPSHRL